MSTRATYKFHPGERTLTRTPVCIYIHYDGYPSGAAVHLFKIFEAENQRGDMATRLIRGNDLAEITESHEIHGDTEYRYDIYGAGSEAIVKASARINYSDTWKMIFEGSLREFIEKHDDCWEDHEKPIFREHKLYDYAASGFVTIPEARRSLEKDLETKAIWIKNGHNRGGNWESLLTRIERTLKSFPELKELCQAEA